MKKLLTFVALIVFTIPFMSPRAEAQTRLVPMIGYDIDWEALHLGLGVEFDLNVNSPVPLALRPSAEYYFIDISDFSLIALNGDVIAELASAQGGIGFSAGGGLAVLIASGSNNTDSRIALNLLGGMDFDAGNLNPFIHARLRLGRGSAIGLLGGIKIDL